MIRTCLTYTLLVLNAAQLRDYTKPYTSTQRKGATQQVSIQIIEAPSTATSITVTVGYDPRLVTPLAGVTLGAAGEVVLTLTGPFNVGAAAGSFTVKCIAPGTCKFPIKGIIAKDAAGAIVQVDGDTLDTLNVRDYGRVRSSL